jgi:hypothetical protein
MSAFEFVNNEDLEVFPTFESMSLRKELLLGVNAYGKNLNPLNYAPFSKDDQHTLSQIFQF